MKIRIDFVTNSSGSSFIVPRNKLCDDQVKAIVNHSELGRMLGLEDADDAWEIEVTDEKVSAFTIMNNFDMGDFLDKIGVDRRVVEWDEYERSYTSYITAETSATWKQLLLTIYST